MPNVKFVRCKVSDVPAIKERGGKPADIYFDYETGTIYVVDREGLPIPLVEVEKEKVDLKTKEGFRNFDLKIEEIELPRMDLLDYIIKELNL